MSSRLPYPGLRPFNRDESDVFFGREAQTDELLRRLARQHFLAVVGGSGCGKSSLVRAGMEAALECGLMSEAGARWRIASMRPGGSPFERLAAALFARSALGPELGDPELARPLIEASLRRGPLGLLEVWEDAALPEKTNFLIIVDQFEEIFRFKEGAGRDEAAAFVALLLATVARRDLPLYVVLTMRTDFLAPCAIFAGLPEALNEGQYLCPRLAREQRRAAIVGPVRVFGADIEPELVTHILNEMDPEPMALPVLQHLLARMWANRINHSRIDGGTYEGLVLTMGDYEAVGGLDDALDRHADEAYRSLAPDRKALCEKIFRRLCERRSGHGDLRSPARLRDIADAVGADPARVIEIVEVFRDPRYGFLTPPPPEPIAAGTMIDISHESLIAGWKRLNEWVGAETRSAQQYRFLSQAATRWKAGQAALWGSPDLEIAAAWRRDEQPTADWAARYGGNFALAMQFLDESQREFDADRLRERDARRRRSRNRLLLAILGGAGGLIGVLLAFIGVRWWLYQRPVTTYYANYRLRVGAPEGVGELTRAQVRGRSFSYEIIRRGRNGPVLRMRAVDSQLRCTPKHQYRAHLRAGDVDSRNECRWEYSYDTRGRLASQHAYDRWGKLVEIVVYVALDTDGRRVRQVYLLPNGNPVRDEDGRATSVEVTELKAGRELRIHYRRRNGLPGRGPNNSFGRVSYFDADGNLTKMTSLDALDAPMTDDAGNATLLLEDHDALGSPRTQRALDAAGLPTLFNEGYAGARTVYDENGNETEITLFGLDGRPATDQNGAHRYTRTYDAHGNVEREANWDIDGMPAASLQTNCHAVRHWYDGRDNEIAFACYGTNLALSVMAGQGFAFARLVYDEHDRVVREGYVDSHGVPMHRDGYASVRLAYDEQNRIKRADYLDPAGQPVIAAGGYASVDTAYDAGGNIVSRSYFGSDGNPILIAEGYAQVLTTYDADGYMLKEQYLDESGRPVITREGYAEIRKAFDSAGYLRQESYHDTAGRPLANSSGQAAYRMETTDLERGGRLVRVESFDELGLVGRGETSGPPKVGGDEAKGGAAATTMHSRGDSIGWLSTYDERGRQVQVEYVDAAGQRVMSSEEEVAGWRRTYDHASRVTSEEFFDPHGGLAVAMTGYARAVHRYDDLGRPVETRYFDANRRPIAPGGYHRVERIPDQRKRQQLIVYYDAEGNATKGDEGYARYLREYDQFGRLIGQKVFDTAGNPALIDGSYFFERRTLDQWGRITEIRHYGIDGETPVRNDKGYHLERRTYDRRGNEIEVAYYDEAGKPVRALAGHAIRRVRYNSRGLESRVDYLDVVDGKEVPARALGWAGVESSYDAAGHVINEAYYDGPDGDRVEVGDGYWESKSTYERGRLVRKEYFNRFAEPVILQGRGYARKDTEYDAGGNEAAVSFYGRLGEPVEPRGMTGCHRMVTRYNSRKQLLELACYDAKLGLKLRSDGYARKVLEYDSWGHLVDWRWYDQKGKPVVTAEGYAQQTRAYDTSGNLVRLTYFDAVGGETTVDGTARIEWEYDELHRVIEERRFGPRNKPVLTMVSNLVLHAIGGQPDDLHCARWRGIYPLANGAPATEVQSWECYSAAGKLIPTP